MNAGGLANNTLSLENVERVGQLPPALDREKIYVLYADTPTERRVLEAFFAQNIAGDSAAPAGQVAWIRESRDRDQMLHEGLDDKLADGGFAEVVPIGVAWKPKSQKQQSWREIMGWTHLIGNNFRQQRMLKSQPERCAVVIGESATSDALRARFLKNTVNDPTNEKQAFADYVALQAALTIDRDSRAATGETVKYPRFVTRSLWGRKDFQAQLEKIAEETGRSLGDVRAEAKACLDEVVPKARAPHVSLAYAFSRAVCKLGYEEPLIYDEQKMAEIREMALSRPLALVFTHKTHIDGLAIILATRDECFPLVHMIGGDNMAIAGVGYLMRRAGAVFIRRSIDSPVYKFVLRRYLSYLMEKRFPVSWALEGTRSRNGKLMPPRFGILKYVVEAAAREHMRDLTIVPVSIYYDLIAELGDYAVEQSGAKKRKESFAWMTDYLRSLRKPLGRISFGLGDPVVVDTTAPDFADAVNAENGEFSVRLQKIAFEASVNANAATPITPSSVLALILAGASPRALTETEIGERTLAIRRWAKDRGLPLTAELADINFEKIRSIANAMIDIGVMARYDDGPEAVYRIADGKHFEASYYRNNAIHFFVEKAIAELALAKAAADGSDPLNAFWKEIAALRDIFKFEFFYPSAEAFNADIDEELSRFDPDWADAVKSGGAHELLTEMRPLVSHAVIRPFAEAYAIIADVLLDERMVESLEHENVVIEAALKYGRQAFLQRRITSEESIGKLMFSNGYQLAHNRGLITGDRAGLAAARLSFRAELDDLVQRLNHIGDLAGRRTEPPAAAAPRYRNGGDTPAELREH